MERVELFKRWRKVAEEVRAMVREKVPEASVYVFGSVIRGDFSTGLSDLDVAIVSPAFEDRDLKLSIYDLLFEKYFSLPIEFHLLTPEKWKFYRRFIGEDFVEIK